MRPSIDSEIRLDAAKLPPLVTWGTSPEQVVSVTGRVPRLEDITEPNKREAAERSLAYMGLKGGEKIADIALDRVFIGSCTNGRIEDLRAAARVVDGKKVNANISAMIVPVDALRAQGDYEHALIEVSKLRPAVDRFFDKVMVMVDDERVRANRLALLQSLSKEFSTIADFSEIVTEGKESKESSKQVKD